MNNTRIYCVYCRTVTLHKYLRTRGNRVLVYACNTCGTVAERDARQECLLNALLSEEGD